MNTDAFNLYENPTYTNDRTKKMSLVIDVVENSESSTKPLTEKDDFRIKLFEPLIIDKKSIIYLDTFITYNSNISNRSDSSTFALKINEFGVKSICGSNTEDTSKLNNSDRNSGKILIPNYNDSVRNYYSTVIHKSKKFNYVATINPTTLTYLTGNITQLNGDPAFGGYNGHNKIFGIFNINSWTNDTLIKDENENIEISSLTFHLHSNNSTTISLNHGQFSGNPCIISDSPGGSSSILISLTNTDYETLINSTDSTSQNPLINNLHNVKSIDIVTVNNGLNNTTTISNSDGKNSLFFKLHQDFRFVAEFVIVSE